MRGPISSFKKKNGLYLITLLIFDIITHFLKMSNYYASARLTTGSEEEDYYFLQPMFEKLPPNEIISQRYAPDVATQVRLMYVSHNAVPRMSARITCTLYPPRPRMQKWKTMHNSLMSSIILAVHTPHTSTRLSTSSSIMPSTTLCPRPN
jgi:hypothetical protein